MRESHLVKVCLHSAQRLNDVDQGLVFQRESNAKLAPRSNHQKKTVRKLIIAHEADSARLAGPEKDRVTGRGTSAVPAGFAPRLQQVNDSVDYLRRRNLEVEI